MKSTLRRATASAAVIGCTLVGLVLAGLPVAVADTSPTPTDSTTTVTTSIGGGDVAVSTTTTASPTTTASTAPTAASTLAPVADTTVPTTTTTTSASTTTSTTVPPQQLADLIQGLNADVAQAQAVSEYLAARALAASGTTGTPAANADPVLVAAAAAQIQADAAQAAAEQRYVLARHRIGQVAIALYLGEQVPHAGAAILGSLGDRSAFLSGVLEAEQSAGKQAKADLARETLAVNERRLKADQLVQARTAQLQAAAVQAATAAQAAAAAGGSSLGAAPVGAAPVAAGGLGLSGTSLSLLTQESPSILGPSILSADELTGWYAASHRQPNLTVPLPALAGDYLTVGATAGVRADIAFAQSILETSYFGFPSFGQVAVTDNNFAGIGACDSCASGYRFPDALTGVTAQMQLLHAYATTGQPFPGPLPGPFRVAGCCATWMALTGVWATASDYGIKILSLYRAMVQWALARRTAAAQL